MSAHLTSESAVNVATTHTEQPPEMSPHPACQFPAERRWLRKSLEDAGMRIAGRMAVGMNYTFGSRAQDKVGIVTYHRVAPHVRGVPPPLHNVTPARFRKQIGGLLRRGFTVWPLRRIVEQASAGKAIPEKTIAITFDDGFETVFTRALPVLRELQVPATVFVSTAYLDSDQPFPFDVWGMRCAGRVPPESYRPLTSSQCREMHGDRLIELGAHAHTHEDFRGRPAEFRADVARSVEVLRSRFGVERPLFAFPFGSRALGFSSDSLAQAAREAGTVCGVTTESALVDPADDPFRWGRFNAFAWDTSATLAAKLADWYSWAPRLRQQLAGLRR